MDIMDTTMPNEMIREQRTPTCYACISILSLLTTLPQALASEVRITSSITADAIYRENVDNEVRSDESVGQLNPTIAISYQSARINASINARATYLERDNSEALNTQRNTFGSYNYNSRAEIVENLLFLSVDGGFTYRDGNALNFLTSDFINSSDSLVKTRTNSVSASIQTQKNRNFIANGIARYSLTETDQSEQGTDRIEDNNYSLSGDAQSTSTEYGFIWNVSGSYIETGRGDSSQSDFMTRNYVANAEINVIGDFGIFATTLHDAYQYESESNGVTTQEFYSFGAGITYRQENQRFLRVAINKQIDPDINVELADDEDINEDDYYLSGELRWALSTRSNLSANYTRRSTGKTGQFALNYNTRRLRARINYSDSVTSYSRLISSPESLGLFVCQQGSSEISSCFQPASLDYDLKTGEQFVDFLAPNYEISDAVINRESLIAQVGLQGRITNLSFNTRYSLDSSIDTGRQTRTTSYGTTLSHNLGVRTNLNLSLTYAKVENNLTDTVELDGESENINGSIVFQHTFRSPLSANFGFYYIERDNNTLVEEAIGLKERRIQLSFTYSFTNRNGARNSSGQINN
ncbi:MAG: TIGR03016 family PEP-CTERM system-associated outer membrane protein [Alteromonadaceae bacterium TMED7]|nr:MAG: TIGR03016 family PEP-CTERM system-associated outer membrane protein [Alteromonadaceae bacterium TMED7]|tara:strand:+ start:44752 stop:46497 length:1746 start_codon:yes stop_codon:yes gene_type:complete